jgi:hypothetical protein
MRREDASIEPETPATDQLKAQRACSTHPDDASILDRQADELRNPLPGGLFVQSGFSGKEVQDLAGMHIVKAAPSGLDRR